MRTDELLIQKKVAIITNNVHCERHVQYFSTVEKYFKANGWIITEDFNAGKIVITGCGFHNAMYEKVERTLKEIRQFNFLEKNIIILACLTKTHEQELMKNFKGYVIGIHQEHLLDELIHAAIPFNDIKPVNVFKAHEKCGAENKEYENFYIKISEGCLRECTFCIINKAKGYISSIPFDTIAAQVKTALKNNRKKILLMGEDTFAYGIDAGTTIIELIKKLITRFPAIELNFGYLHIRWLRKYARDIVSLCKQGVLKELHIGIQHVNDHLLKQMGRPVIFSEIYETIREIKRECPGFYMVADILIGFPGETEEIFNEVLEFFKQDTCFNKVKHFGYSDVKGAPSTDFKDKVPADVIAHRWDLLDKVLGERAYSNQVEESRIDNETFRITRFDDYSFCKDTFDEMIDAAQVVSRDLTPAKHDLIEKDHGDFGF